MSQQSGGYFGVERIEWFNGSLFDGAEVIPLETAEIDVLRAVARLDWSEIEPAIFGTLFERGLDPDRRQQLGAHYTDRESIARLVEPVLMKPLRRDFEALKQEMNRLTYGQPLNRLAPQKRRAAEQLLNSFLERVRTVTVLDPACGSGNFLYIALQALKDLEREVLIWASTELRLPVQFPHVGPHQLRGIEISPAAELTRVTIWIGQIQWMIRNGFGYERDPILRPLDNIETRDALDGRSNRAVVRRWVNGLDITRRPRNRWIVDFGYRTTREAAALYQAPFEHVERHVKPFRDQVRRKSYRERWWLHAEPVIGMRRAVDGLARYIATPALTKHRLFVWLPADVLADHQLVVIARDDDYIFGVLHSRVHEGWARGMGTQLREYESGFRYTPTTTFETFPFPRPAHEQREAIAVAARRLNELREGWLNPRGAAADELQKRTLTNLYNEMPAWLRDAHAAFDRAVLDAYGWRADISDEDLLARLLDLNQARAAASVTSAASVPRTN